GLIAVREAFPILAAFNVGDTVLIFIATFDVRGAALVMTGVTAILLYFVKREDWRRLLGVLMGMGLVFYSISEMKEGVGPLQQMPLVTQLVAAGANEPLLSITVGVVLGFVLQSSTVVAAIGVGLVKAGLLDMPQTLVMAYASAVGSSLFKVVLGRAFTGSARQIVQYQNIFNFLGATIFVGLFYLEKFFQVPLVMALVRHASDQPETQVAVAFLLFKFTSAAILTVADSPIAHWLEKNLPKSAEEDLSAPQYISRLLPEEASAELELIRREQLREVSQIAEFFSTLREPAQGLPLDRRLAALGQLGGEVENALRATMALSLDEQDGLELTYLQRRQTVIMELAEVVGDLVLSIGQARARPALSAIAGQTLEGMEFLLLTVAADLESSDPEARQTLLGLCSDRGPMMENWRKSYLQQDGTQSLEDRSAVLSLTGGVEKCVWLLRQLTVMDHRGER
ncbi:MAG TPA: Na/Pi symporter, partial [Opitutales bacterium]|nr:Na/Pi symporter [Opitutales bacterium]